MSDRDAILGRLPSSRPLAEPPGTQASIPPLDDDLWAVFQERLEALGGRLLTLSGRPTPGAIADATGVRLDAAIGDLAGLAPHKDPWTATVGVTWAEIAIAETGSLIVRARPNRSRLTSLTPPIHIALIRNDAIVPHLEDAMGAFAQDRTAVIITGPSRTADIEGVLVRGVHGPGELIVVRVD